MTEEEYKAKREAIEEARNVSIRKLKFNYALSNNTVKVGDMVTDHIGTVKVEDIRAWGGFRGLPSCVYRGQAYTKKGKLSKRDGIRDVYQTNLFTQSND